MKYMGSKRSMLKGNLAVVLKENVKPGRRFVDLFAGAGAVSWYSAEQLGAVVTSVDLQEYSRVLSGTVVCRTAQLDSKMIWAKWSRRAVKAVAANSLSLDASELQVLGFEVDTALLVRKARSLCKQSSGAISSAYGGHYFSPSQAIVIDALRNTLPKNRLQREACLAALIVAVSRCSASPGHTAQPFQPTSGASKFLADAWNRDVWSYTRRALSGVCERHARTRGRALKADAATVATRLAEGDIAFVDPPYSGVHYSRFYHVLETVANGHNVEVSGRGRYPDLTLRPRSKYSLLTESEEAFQKLCATIASKGAKLIVTYPSGDTSNGLSGTAALEIVKKSFRTSVTASSSQFSTLGGNGDHREARKFVKEQIIVGVPK